MKVLFLISMVELRKITLILLAELLHENHELKEKFCHIMNIHPCPGKVLTTFIYRLCSRANFRKIFSITPDC